MKYSTLLFAIAAILLLGCAKEHSNENSQNSDKSAETKQDNNKEGVTITPFSPSQEFGTAKIENYNYDEGRFSFDIAEGDYKLGVQTPDAPQKMCANSAKGQHIHLIVDNAPYSAQYSAIFDYEIEDGEHDVLAFLSRSYHESIKSPGAFRADRVLVQDGSITRSETIQTPMLFYSRPKGTYIGKANTEKVMLDYYLVNIPEDSKYAVKATINSTQEVLLDKWQPYYLEGLPMGENTVTLSLIDPRGNEVEHPTLPVTRKFTLKADPMDEEL